MPAFRTRSTPTVAVIFDALARRLAREPSAYITGHKEFYGLDLGNDA